MYAWYKETFWYLKVPEIYPSMWGEPIQKVLLDIAFFFFFWKPLIIWKTNFFEEETNW